MKLLQTSVLRVIALALWSTRKARRNVEVTVAEQPELKIDWFPTADGLRSEMWH